MFWVDTIIPGYYAQLLVLGLEIQQLFFVINRCGPGTIKTLFKVEKLLIRGVNVCHNTLHLFAVQISV